MVEEGRVDEAESSCQFNVLKYKGVFGGVKEKASGGG